MPLRSSKNNNTTAATTYEVIAAVVIIMVLLHVVYRMLTNRLADATFFQGREA